MHFCTNASSGQEGLSEFAKQEKDSCNRHQGVLYSHFWKERLEDHPAFLMPLSPGAWSQLRDNSLTLTCSRS